MIRNTVCFMLAVLLMGASAQVRADDSSDTSTQVKPQKKKHRVVVIEDDQDEASAISTAMRESGDESSDPLTRVQLRPIISYSFLNPVALNGFLSASTLKLINTPFNIGGAATLSLAADYEISSRFSAGVRMDWFNSTTAVAQITGQNSTFANLQGSMAALPIYATATYRQPLANHWNLAFTGGAGLPAFFTTGMTISGSTITGVTNGVANYAANPFTWIGTASLNYEVGSTVAVRLEGGYRYLYASQMNLTSNYAGQQAGSVFQDANNSAVPVDASSAFVGVGAMIAL